MLNGAVNAGLPPLHSDMAVGDWSRAFNAAYRHLCRAVDQGLPTVLDPYAAESPGEFFASVSEAFFETIGTGDCYLSESLSAVTSLLSAESASTAAG